MLWVSAATAEGFNFKDTKGKVHRLEDYKGKWVLVNFWATWCPPCLEEMPALQKLHETRKDLVVIGIAMEYQNAEYVKQFADDLLVTFPIVLGDRKIAAQIGKVPGLPTTYLYNPAGQVAAYNVGALTLEAVERYIDSKKAAVKVSAPK
ncbi:MAG: TlpA family protein disulfide reductase [Burkholderiales bacterium]|nr:TlpA family protein disulfide reductase [Burkholderiales bacterium]